MTRFLLENLEDGMSTEVVAEDLNHACLLLNWYIGAVSVIGKIKESDIENP